jgi:hypothetical protein
MSMVAEESKVYFQIPLHKPMFSWLFIFEPPYLQESGAMGQRVCPV